MADVKITLTEDMLKLISNIHFTEVPVVSENTNKEVLTWGIDFNSLYGGNYLYEDIAYILGRYDEKIEGTENDVMGARFVPEFENYMYDMHTYIVDNIGYIEDLLHYFCNKQCLVPGTYVLSAKTKIWKLMP